MTRLRWPLAWRSTVALLERRIASLIDIGNRHWSVNHKLRQELERAWDERKRLRAEVTRLNEVLRQRKEDIRRMTDALIAARVSK